MTAERAISTIRLADLPSPPKAALDIMDLCSKPGVKPNQLGQIINTHPVLSAELIRIVNSPFYGLAKEISSIKHALVIVGFDALRNLVLCVSVKNMLGKKRIEGLDTTAYWEDALRRAVAAKMLAPLCKTDPDQCFTAGLLQDFGLLVLLHYYKDKGKHWQELRAADPLKRIEMETEHFGQTHDEVNRILADSWKLPKELKIPLGHHHYNALDEIEPEIIKICHILECADWITAVYTADDKKLVLENTRRLAKENLGLQQDVVNDVLENLPNEVEVAGQALGLRVKSEVNYEEVLRQCQVTLADENQTYQQLTWELNKALEDRNRYAEKLNQEMTIAQEVQQSLLPQADRASVPVYGFNIPAKTLSGDFYDFFRIANGKVFFNIADVSGKGITAALLMAKTCSLFHCMAKQVDSLAKLMTILNSEICENSIRGMFVTMVAGVYDPESDRVDIINAGHLPAFLVNNSKIIELPAQALPLGIVSDWKFKQFSFKLDGMSLYAFTDGISEYKLEDGTMLGLEKLKRIIADKHTISAQNRLDAILTAVSAGKELVVDDDITFILMDCGQQ